MFEVCNILFSVNLKEANRLVRAARQRRKKQGKSRELHVEEYEICQREKIVQKFHSKKRMGETGTVHGMLCASDPVFILFVGE